MSATKLFDEVGRPVILDGTLGIGGEGTVYNVVGAPDLAAKLYHPPKPATHGEKLRLMVATAKKELHSIAAWPVAVLSERVGGSVVGFVMRKLKGFKELHILYSPAHRKQTFPHADWKFLIHTAANCAAAFHIAHSQGVVVGDVNEKNLFVSGTGEVAFIDCDSFQVQVAGRTFPCEVGVPLFTPPELMGRAFRGITRTVHHDGFGLAVLVFHLLFMGRHPFSGRYGGPGEMPIEKAIQESRFAYGQAAHALQMQPPLHALRLSAVTPKVATLFERAFGHQATTTGRPAAAEWFQALTEFGGTLRRCGHDSGHQFPSHVSGCIWCELMKRGAPNFFISVAFAAATGPTAAPTFALATVWARIDAVARPSLGIARPTPPAKPTSTPWPAQLLKSVPPKPVKPAILASPPRPPEPDLPPARYSKVALPYTPRQWALGYVALGVLACALPCSFLASVLARVLALNPKLVGWLLYGVEAFVVFVVSIWWVILERQRKRHQADANELYLEERGERRRLADEQLAAWQQEHDRMVTVAENWYHLASQSWEYPVMQMRQEADRRRVAAREAAVALARAESAWGTLAAQILAEFDRKKAELAGLRDRHVDLVAKLGSERQQLLARAREYQLRAFLEGQFIEDADIEDIGPTRKATLASEGIETAHDVNEHDVRAIQGFGPKLTARLMDWRARVQAAFRFNPSVGVPEPERQALEFKYFQQRQPIEVRLSDGERQLAEIVQRVRSERQLAMQRVYPLAEAAARTTADVTVIPSGV